MNYFELMEQSCKDSGLVLDNETFEKFNTYKNLLQEWNEKINLTAITDDDGVYKKHFIDSLKIFKAKEIHEAKTIIDVGTGAGFPGLPIAIMNNNIEVTLLDSLNKRINFLDTVVAKVGLKNVTTIHSRAEDGARRKDLREKFDIATSRAVANMCVLSEYTLPYVKVGGYLIALKGPAVEEEILESKNAVATLGGKIEEIIQVDIEGTDLKHNLVVVKKVKKTPPTYPRKAGSITKKPLK